MADEVQYRMERMVDELEDLERRGLFTRREIAEIVRKRRDFEYRVKRHCPLKRDFLSYADYETQLDALRVLRKRAIIRNLRKRAEMESQDGDSEEGEEDGKKRKKGKNGGKLWKRSISDTAGVSRIIGIYRRATVRFKGDLGLWFRYLEFCRSCRNGRMKQVLAEAIRFHPKVPGLWMYAAAWEFDKNLNVAAARALMQAGLRTCPDSEDMWVEYLRMELTYLNKLRARKAAVGEDVTTSFKKKSEVGEMSEWKEKNTDVFMPLNEKREEIKDADVFDGALEKNESFFWEQGSVILQTIYHEAIKAIPSSMSLRKRFLEILEQVDIAHSNELKNEVMKDMREKFLGDAYYWDWLARFHIHGAKIGRIEVEGEAQHKLKEAIQVYEEALRYVPSTEMVGLYTSFLLEIVAPDIANSGSSNDIGVQNEELKSILLDVYKSAESRGCLNEDLACQYILFNLRIGGFEDARELVLRFCRDVFSESAKLWILRASIEMKQLMDRAGAISIDDLDYIFELLRSALARSIFSEANALCFMSLKFFSQRKEYFNKLLDCFVMLFARSGGDNAVDSVTSAIVNLVLLRDGLQHARKTYKRFLALPHPTLPLFKYCIELESNLALVGDISALVIARKLYESALNLYPNARDVWRNYYSMEIKVGSSETANAVYWRACKVLGEGSDLANLFLK